MVSKRYLSLLMVAVFSIGNIASEKKDEIKNRLFADCILREIDGKIWLQQQLVYLGMVGVAWTPPFCLSEELAKKFRPLVSKLTENNKEGGISYDFFDQVLREHKGNLTVVSLNTKIRPVYDKEFSKDRKGILSDQPGYYEIIEADLLNAEFVSSGWIESWRTLDGILENIVTESKTSPDNEKKKRIETIIRKGESVLNTMHKARQTEEFKTLVSKVDPNSQVTPSFTRGITFRWQEWFEKFANRLDVKLQNKLPEMPKLSAALELLAKCRTIEEFQASKKKVPEASLELFYSMELGKKVKTMESGSTFSFKFETLRASAEELLPEVLKNEKAAETNQEMLEQKASEESGLVIRPADAKVLRENQILSGLVVESISDKKEIPGIEKGDIIIDYERVYDVVMGQYSMDRAKQIITNAKRQEKKLCVLRDNKVIYLSL